MENRSIHRKTIDWSGFKSRVYEKAGDAQTVAETYEAIDEALTILGDNHSLLRTSDGAVLYGVRKKKCEVESIPPVSVPDNIGYIKITSFVGGGEKAADFAEELQNQIRAADSPSLVGWIVDLRGNTGGNMWPMLAGVSPILGEDTVGYFQSVNQQFSPWEIRDGSSYGGNSLATLVPQPYTLINPEPKVAVLLDNGVMSSGEATAIAFVGRENTRSFGSPTCGASTGNVTNELSDGSVLILTVSYMADRNQKVYGIPVEPDEVVEPEEVVQRAVEWLTQ